jgi:hypothetical protein
MPTITRTVAKGIPPRTRSPARRNKRNKAGKKKAIPKKNHKRHAATESDDENETTDPENLAPEAKSQRRSNKRRREGSVEVEVVGDEADESQVEEIEDTVTQPALSDGNEVSMNICRTTFAHAVPGG